MNHDWWSWWKKEILLGRQRCTDGAEQSVGSAQSDQSASRCCCCLALVNAQNKRQARVHIARVVERQQVIEFMQHVARHGAHGVATGQEADR